MSECVIVHQPMADASSPSATLFKPYCSTHKTREGLRWDVEAGKWRCAGYDSERPDPLQNR